MKYIMKTRYILMSVAAAAMTFVSCVKDNVSDSVFSDVTLNAVTEGGQTKTALTGFADVVWSTGDKIAVWDGTAFTDFTLVSGEGTASADFSGTLAAGKTATAAVYPAAAKGSDMSAVKYPAEYTYSEMGVNAPMVADVAEGLLEFKHVGGVAKFDVYNIPATAAAFVFTANSKITGDFTVTSGAVATSGTTPESVKINFTPGSMKSATFMVPLPTGTYNGFSVKFVDAQGAEVSGTTKTTDKSVVVERADLKTFKAYSVTPVSTKQVLWEGTLDLTWAEAFQGFAYGNPVPDFQVGDVLRIHFQQNGDDNFGLKLVQPIDGWPSYDGLDNIPWWNGSPIDITVTEELRAGFKENGGFVVQGNHLTLTKLELIPAEEPETVIWTGEFDAIEIDWCQDFKFVPMDVDQNVRLGFYFEVSQADHGGWTGGNVVVFSKSGTEVGRASQTGTGVRYGEVEVPAANLSEGVNVVLQYVKLHKVVMK